MSRPARSLAARALLALALGVGWYVLGAAIVAVLVAVPLTEASYRGSVTVGGLTCLGCGVLIAWGLLPPLAAFRRAPDPPAIPADAHPRLRAVVAEVFALAGLAPPRDIILMPDANAFTARRTAWLGLRSWRILGLGLPLVAELDENELRAVIAHEIGHHHGGDVLLGPLVHRFRIVVAEGADRLEDSSGWLHVPFTLYSKLVLTSTAAVSRGQELAADALAARSCGAGAMASSLVKVEELAPSWQAFWQCECVPLLQAGRRPALLDGFERFRATRNKREEIVQALQRAANAPASPHDSHPPLAERLRELGPHPGATPAPRASLLLDSIDDAEQQALAAVVAEPARLTPVAWDDVVAAHLPQWREAGQMFGRMAKPRDLPQLLDDPELVRARSSARISVLSPRAERRRAAAAAGSWMIAWLHDCGFAISAPVGGEIVARRGSVTLQPRILVRELETGALDGAAFRSRIDAAMAAPGGPAD